MSKTDKTKPPKVQIAENAVADHNHSKGTCDLPTLAEWLKMPKRDRWTHSCTWEPTNWRNITYRRYGGEKDYMAEKTRRKYPDWKSA